MPKAIFYARFNPERGPSVIHQYPTGAIKPDKDALLSFSDVSAYIIPPYELCNQPLSICTKGHRVLGFPISLEDAKYERNRFTFNVCIVLEETEYVRPWTALVKKTAAFFVALEEEDGLLQAEERLAGLKWAGEEGYPARDVGMVQPLLEAIVQDINLHGETCIRIDDLHVLNLRLTQPLPTPPKAHAWDVPLIVRPLPATEEWTWDLTPQRIRPHMDGVKHIQRIAELADVELKLVKRAVRDLMYHERVILLDIFHFQAIYAPTADFALFVRDEEMIEECCGYIAIDPAKNCIAAGQVMNSSIPEKETIIDLYAHLSPGLTVYDFVVSTERRLSNIDIRRFITFGVIKGFLRRIHKYALVIDSPSSRHLSANNSSPSKSKPKSNEDAVKEFDRAWKKAALSSGWATPPPEPPPPVVGSLGRSQRSAEEVRSEEDEKLRGYLDGEHCLDEVCVAMRMSERKLVERIRSGPFGEVVLFNK